MRPPASPSPLALRPRNSTSAIALEGRSKMPLRRRVPSAHPSTSLITTLLTSERLTRWVITAMHLAMAVGTGTIEDEPRLGGLGGGRMAGLDVTLLTKSWLENLEERFMVRAVGVVAVRAALQHRRVL